MGLIDTLLGRPPQRHSSTTIAPALTASAQKVEASQGTEGKQALRRLIQPWQQSALTYYDALGECWYPAQFYGRALARLRLFPAERQPDGELKESDNAKAQEALGRVQDPGGGRSDILRTYGQLKFVAGECYLIVTQDGDGAESWEMVSTDELRINPGSGYTRFKAPQFTPEFLQDVPDDAYEALPKSAVVYRFWTRHPRYSALADSPTKGVLALYDLLTRLRAAEIANSKNRAANAGVLFLNQDIKFKDPGTQDDDPNQNTFIRDLTTAMVAAIKDPGEASAAVPMVAEVPGELIKDKAVYDYLKFRDGTELSESELIDHTIRHIALGLDIPPEVMLGLDDTNHWNAWMVQDETWQSHLGPVAQSFCNDLTAAYFQPFLRDQKVAGWENLVVAYDATEIINHPDRGKDALQAFENGVIGPDALRDALGFSDEDGPSPEELKVMIGWKANEVSTVTGEEPIAEGTTQNEVTTGKEADAGATKGNEVKPGPPDELDDPNAETVASIVAMAGMAVDRCRELAGSRLRTHARNCETCVEKLKDVEQELVASALGFDAATELHAPTPSDLVAGGTRLFDHALASVGVTEEWSKRLCEIVELHAARTLYNAKPSGLPSSFTEAARRAL